MLGEVEYRKALAKMMDVTVRKDLADALQNVSISTMVIIDLLEDKKVSLILYQMPGTSALLSMFVIGSHKCVIDFLKIKLLLDTTALRQSDTLDTNTNL